MHGTIPPLRHTSSYRSVYISTRKTREPGQRSRYSDWLRAGRPRGRSSGPGRGKICFFSMSSRPVPGPTQRPIQWVRGEKQQGREADHLSQASAEVKIMWIWTSIAPITVASRSKA
jgi:hypothetical protein